MEADAGGTAVESLRIRKFEVGDLVFAKLKGYPPWPSKINQIECTVSGGKERVRYNVYFYGTHQSSILRSSCLYHYDLYAKAIVDKWGRRPKFHEALEELERELMANIEYLKELRNTPDSVSPNFTNACNVLESDVRKKRRVPSETDSEWDEESRARGFEIIYIERIPFPDTPESLLVVSLDFNKDWVREEAQRIEEEERMMNCHVRIEPFPEEYGHLIDKYTISPQAQASVASLDQHNEIHENSCNEILDDSFNGFVDNDCNNILDDVCNVNSVDRHNKILNDCSSIPERVMRYPRQVERKTFYLSRRKKIKSTLKNQEGAAVHRTGKLVSLSKRKRRGQKRKPSEESDSDMETCPHCRLCFFSESELMEHKKKVHGAQNSESDIYTVSDTESETDIIFKGVKPVTQKKQGNHFQRSEITQTNTENSFDMLNQGTVYLTEGFPVDSITA